MGRTATNGQPPLRRISRKPATPEIRIRVARPAGGSRGRDRDYRPGCLERGRNLGGDSALGRLREDRPLDHTRAINRLEAIRLPAPSGGTH
jgi:hypothetical protein